VRDVDGHEEVDGDDVTLFVLSPRDTDGDSTNVHVSRGVTEGVFGAMNEREDVTAFDSEWVPEGLLDPEG
jgi:hypothetical protein